MSTITKHIADVHLGGEQYAPSVELMKEGQRICNGQLGALIGKEVYALRKSLGEDRPEVNARLVLMYEDPSVRSTNLGDKMTLPGIPKEQAYEISSEVSEELRCSAERLPELLLVQDDLREFGEPLFGIYEVDRKKRLARMTVIEGNQGKYPFSHTIYYCSESLPANPEIISNLSGGCISGGLE